ncbi:MAG TPA: hypothetical protein VGF75_04730, partial [Candidatus Saccharimonadales bacterium]
LGGGYDLVRGIAYIKVDSDKAYQAHTTIHEIGHGLTAPSFLFEHEGRILPSGGGVYQGKARNGDKVRNDLVVLLEQLNEGVVDLFALSSGAYDPAKYHRDKVAYQPYVAALLRMNASDPYVLHHIIQACFVNGLESAQEAENFVVEFHQQGVDYDPFNELFDAYFDGVRGSVEQ